MKRKLNKKVFASLTAALMIGVSSITFAASFEDVPKDHWAYESVMSLGDKGIIKVGGNYFGDRNANKFEVALMLNNFLSKIPNVKSASNVSFEDVPKNHWAYSALSRLAANGIIRDGGNFFGNKDITRFELSIMLTNLLEKNPKNLVNGNSSFSDVPKNHWAYKFVKTVADNGIMKGYGNDTFNGDKNINRFELALILNKVYDKLFD